MQSPAEKHRYPSMKAYHPDAIRFLSVRISVVLFMIRTVVITELLESQDCSGSSIVFKTWRPKFRLSTSTLG